MYSAFGVEHGEIAKARFIKPRNPMRGMPGGRPATKAQRATQGQGGPTGPEKVKGVLNRIGEADVSLKGIGAGAGRGMRGAGNFLESHPGLTGTALVSGSGAAGYKYLSGSQPPRKKKR